MKEDFKEEIEKVISKMTPDDKYTKIYEKYCALIIPA